MTNNKSIYLGTYSDADASKLARSIDECIESGYNGAFMINENRYVVVPNNYGGRVKIISESGESTTTMNGDGAARYALNEIAPLLGAALAGGALQGAKAIGGAIKNNFQTAKGFLNGGVQGAKNARAQAKVNQLSTMLTKILTKIGTPQAQQAAQVVQKAVQGAFPTQQQGNQQNAQATQQQGNQQNAQAAEQQTQAAQQMGESKRNEKAINEWLDRKLREYNI